MFWLFWLIFDPRRLWAHSLLSLDRQTRWRYFSWRVRRFWNRPMVRLPFVLAAICVAVWVLAWAFENFVLPAFTRAMGHVIDGVAIPALRFVAPYAAVYLPNDASGWAIIVLAIAFARAAQLARARRDADSLREELDDERRRSRELGAAKERLGADFRQLATQEYVDYLLIARAALIHEVSGEEESVRREFAETGSADLALRVARASQRTQTLKADFCGTQGAAARLAFHVAADYKAYLPRPAVDVPANKVAQ